MNPGDFNANVRRITDTLNRHGVNYIIIGGVAGQLHGSARPTNDVDVVAESSADNVARFGEALRELNARIRGAPELPPPVIQAQLHPAALAQRQFGNGTTEAGDLDTALFIGTPAEPLSFEALQAHAVQADHQGVPLVIAGLGDIIKAKEIAGRDKTSTRFPELRLLRGEYHARPLLLVLNLPLVGVWVQVLRIPRPYLYAGILLFAASGGYSLNGVTADLVILFVAALLGWTMRRFGYPIAPLVVGLILGPIAEEQLRPR